MKQFLAFIRKEFRHVLRDKRTMLILLGMPVAQIILFGFAISTEIRNIDTVLLVPETGENTRRQSEKFDASDYYSVSGAISAADGLYDLYVQRKADLATASSPSCQVSVSAAD